MSTISLPKNDDYLALYIPTLFAPDKDGGKMF